MPVLNQADSLFLGSVPVDAVYLGGTKVWPSGLGLIGLDAPDPAPPPAEPVSGGPDRPDRWELG